MKVAPVYMRCSEAYPAIDEEAGEGVPAPEHIVDGPSWTQWRSQISGVRNQSCSSAISGALNS
jgi:hypothetical protein